MRVDKPEIDIFNVEVVVVVMKDDIGDGVIGWGGRLRKVFIEDEFESSRANNVGASVAGSDIFVFQDADIVFDPSCYFRVLGLLGGGVESVRVGRCCVDLSEDVTAGVEVGGVDFGLLGSGGGSVRDAPGGCSAITRGAFVRIGGYCELFKYYGWEDVYYRYKVERLTNHVTLGCDMFHLWHECNFQRGGWDCHRGLWDELLVDFEGCVERDRRFLVERYEGLR